MDPFQNFPEKVDEIRDVRNYVEVRTGGSEGEVRRSEGQVEESGRQVEVQREFEAEIGPDGYSLTIN